MTLQRVSRVRVWFWWLLAVGLAGRVGPPAAGADWPMWGRDATRNAVSPETGAPTDFAFPVVERGKVGRPGRGVAWSATLGDRTTTTPVVADGLVWVCTNARHPADNRIPAKDWDGGVLMALRESDGKPLWAHRTPRLSGPGVEWYEDFPRSALGSCPLVEGDRLWYVTNRSEVVCLDIGPLKAGSGEPRVVWSLDMRRELGIKPHLPLMQSGFAASVAGYKDRLFVITHNGIGADFRTVPRPAAPSLVCLEKARGRVRWRDNSPGRGILEHQISSPLVVEVHGEPQVIVGQGDGWLRSFDPDDGHLLWKCDLNPKDAVWNRATASTRNYLVATPVLYDGRVYIATGRQVEDGIGVGALYCIDPAKSGDVSRELDAGQGRGKPNPNSAVVWHTPPAVPADAPTIEVGTKKKRDLLRSRDYYFGRCIASVTVSDGLVYAAESDGYIFCFDARTGRLYWGDDLRGAVWGQPLVADGKVYVATDGGDLFVYAHARDRKRLARVEAPDAIHPGLIFANRTLYVAAGDTLFAFRNPK